MKELLIKYAGYLILLGLVVAVGGIAVFFYVDHFGANEFSDDPGDWAHFATYISGTVGVAAVVATLVAFVITLRQQQKLIDSQDKMLKKQKKQLKINKKQLKEEEERRAVELAHNSAVKVFPILVEKFKKELLRSMSIYDDEVDLFSDLRGAFKKIGVTYDDFFFNSEMFVDLFENHEPKVVFDVVERVFSSSERIYNFSSNHLEIAPDLKEFFQAYMFEEVGSENELCEYVWCYHAFLMGRGKKDCADLGVRYLGFPEDYNASSKYYMAWIEIGRMLRDV